LKKVSFYNLLKKSINALSANGPNRSTYLCRMTDAAVQPVKKIQNIRHLGLADLEHFLLSIGEKKFRAKQIWEWLWQKHAQSFADMTNLSKELRQKLGENFSLPAIAISNTQY